MSMRKGAFHREKKTPNKKVAYNRKASNVSVLLYHFKHFSVEVNEGFVVKVIAMERTHSVGPDVYSICD